MFFVPFAKVHKYIVDRIVKTKKLIILVMVPRRFGKTKIISFGFIIWAVLFKKFRYVLHISNNLEDKGKQIMRDLQRGFESRKFVKLFGDWHGKFWGQTKIHLYSEKWHIDTVIEMRGWDQSVFGASEWKSRPDLIVIDDAETLSTVRNKDLINNMLEKFKTEIIPAAETKDEHGRAAKIIVIGTPLAPYTFLTVLAGKEWKKYVELIKFSALVDSRKIPGMGEILGLPEDSSIWEARWSTEVLHGERQFWIDTNSYTTWLSQYMMDPVSDTPMQFVPDKLIEVSFKSVQKLIPQYKVVTTVDMAYTERTQNDPIGTTTALHLPGSKIIYLESFSGRMSADKLFEHLYGLRKKYEKAGEYITSLESKAFGLVKRYFWEVEIRTGHHLEIMSLHDDNRNKNDRIAMLIPYYEVGLLEFIEGTNRPLLSEMWTWFGKSVGHEDALDAAAYQVKFVEISEDKIEEEKIEEKEISDELKDIATDAPNKTNAKRLLMMYDKESKEKKEMEDYNDDDEFGWFDGN